MNGMVSEAGVYVAPIGKSDEVRDRMDGTLGEYLGFVAVALALGGALALLPLLSLLLVCLAVTGFDFVVSSF